MANGLAQQLRTATRDAHRASERAGIMPDLLHGRLGRAVYCSLLRNLFEIYQALEAALVLRAALPCVAPVVFPKLFRTAALAADLDVLYRERWRAELDPQPTTLIYVGRLQRIEKERPELLAAHAYVRYLGDLSGGQMLSKIVADSLGLGNGLGTRFYDFGPAQHVAEAAQALRAGLEAIPADESQLAAIVAEALHAFDLHRALFAELADEDPDAIRVV